MINKMITIWISGVTASGKTTLGKELYKKLKTTSDKDFRFLDGEDLRKILKKNYGHSLPERFELIKEYIGFVKEENMFKTTCSFLKPPRPWRSNTLRVWVCLLPLRAWFRGQPLRDVGRDVATPTPSMYRTRARCPLSSATTPPASSSATSLRRWASSCIA